MIANQISELDLKLEIREEAPVVLNSARLAYATNCVHIFEENDYVVCDGEGDRILVYDMDITRVFELVQAIFDAHEDWRSKIKAAVENQNYQAAMDEAYKMFKNPMVLFDANNKVLGRTSVYGEHSLDSEWAYLTRYGFSSVKAINMMKFDCSNEEFYSKDKIRYTPSQNQIISLGGISRCLYFDNTICGRINLIAKERPLNQGDMQLMDQLIEILQPAMGESLLRDPIIGTGNVFLNVMREELYDQEKLQMQLQYMGWHAEDTYYMTLIRFAKQEEGKSTERELNSLMRMLLQNLQGVSIFIWQEDLILLSIKDLSKEYDSRTLLRNIVVHNPVCMGFSLPDQEGIGEIARIYRQAKYALSRGSKEKKPKAVRYFETYATEYLLTSLAPVHDKIMAVMPGVYRLWKEKQSGDEMFHTLLCFLDHERSIAQTSAELFTHRNTIVYRIKKIQERMDVDLDDATVRNYCLTSMHFLDALEKSGEMI